MNSEDWIVVQMECPNGHGLMTFFRNAPSDDEDDFFECSTCGAKTHVVGQRSAEEEVES